MRVLVLVIATKRPLCQMHTEYWQRVLKSCPPEVDVRFIRADPSLAGPIAEAEASCVPREVVVKTRECFVPGIFIKTIRSMEHLIGAPEPAREDEQEQESEQTYDWVLRTNTSTFIHFSNLLKLLPTLDPSAYYGSMVKRAPRFTQQRFAVGFFILFSSDVARKLLGEYSRGAGVNVNRLPDDVALAKLAEQSGLDFKSLSRQTVLPHMFHKHLLRPRSNIIAIRNRNYEPTPVRLVAERKRWEQIVGLYSISE
jgi:hypothetical protein